MTATSRGQRLARFLERLRALFNLNDPGWGRSSGGRSDADQQGSDSSDSGNKPASPPQPPGNTSPPPPPPPRPAPPPSPPPQGSSQQPPDLGELLGDLNRKLKGLLGNTGGGRRPPNNHQRGPAGGGFKPPVISKGVVGSAFVVAVLLWLASGFFVVQEGHQAVVLNFGKYVRTVDAGLRYNFPAPIGRNEIVDMRIQSMPVGSDALVPETGLNQYAMLTQDENIVEVLFTVQYRIVNARDWLFNAQQQESTIDAVAESAVRQIVGNMSMDDALAIRREEIAPTLRRLMQAILDRYGLGVDVVAINMQSSGVRPPDSVRDAFEDVLRAEQERVRSVNEATAYANTVIPRAEGEADRMLEEAQAYRLQVEAESAGDADRFDAILAEYQRAPQVTRERMYLETMEDIYKNANKVLVEDSSNNLMYLPLDKLMEEGAAARAARQKAAASPAGSGVGTTHSSGSIGSTANTQQSSTPRPIRGER